MGQPVQKEAWAKINLCLEVLGRRKDGLHEVATVLQSITLSDHLVFTEADQLSLRCRGIAVDPDNLILRSARVLADRTGRRTGCSISCEKRIPIGGGLGGGSADASATLRGLNQLWGTKLSVRDLEGLGAELGADVPFAVRGGTALATGSGRDLETLPLAPTRWVVLAPLGSESSAKTREMYSSLTESDFGDGDSARRLSEAIRRGELDAGSVRSSFTRAACARWPASARALSALVESKAEAASVSGAGPTVFGLYASRAAALRGMAAVRARGIKPRLCRFLSGDALA